MTYPEYPAESFDEIDAEFQRIVENEIQHDNSMYSIESAEYERTTLINALIDHLMVFDSMQCSSREEMIETAHAINTCIKKDFENLSGLDYGDEIMVSGRTIALFFEQHDDTNQFESRTLALVDDMRIKGTIHDIAIQEIPLAENLHLHMDEDRDIPDNLDTNNFGLVLQLTDATLEDGGDYSEPVPDNLITFIPLNYPELKLHRVIRQETV